MIRQCPTHVRPQPETCSLCVRDLETAQAEFHARKARGETTQAKSRAVSPEMLRRMEQAMACVHRGAKTGERVECESCNVPKTGEVHTCDRFGLCVLDLVPKDRGIQTCRICQERTPPPVPEIWPGLPDPLPVHLVERGWNEETEWAKLPRVQRQHQEALQSLLSARLPRPSPDLTGDGVVLCGGGRYWAGNMVGLRMLRDLGCALPVQIWHRGDMEPVRLEDLEGWGPVTVRDLTAIRPAPRILRSWDAKTLAILHSGFRRVLWLDADAYAVANPTPLFGLLDRAPFVFWQDLDGTAGNVKWEAFGLSPNHAKVVAQIQGGHLLMDVPAFWRQLLLSHWLNQHSEWAYKFGFSEQEQYRVAIGATGGASLNLGPCPWINAPHLDRREPAGGFICGWQGVPYFVHRCRSKMVFERHRHKDYDNRRCYELPLESQAWAHFEAIRSAHKV